MTGRVNLVNSSEAEVGTEANPLVIKQPTTGGVLATEAKQDIGNASVASIDSKTPTLGQKEMAASQPVVISSDQSIINMRLASSATAAAAGLFPTVTGYGVLRVSPESSMQFFDAFDTDDTVNLWTLKTSTGTSAIANGILTSASSTTANAYGGRFSIPTIRPRGINFVGMGAAVRFNNLSIANTVRWMGIGSLPATPTAALPVTDGIGFLLDGAGSLFAKIYAAGVEVGSLDLTAYKPANNAWTRLAMSYRSDIALFYVGTSEYPVGSITFTNPSIQTLPLSVVSVAGAVAPTTSATIDVMAWGVGDTGRNQQGICDPDFPSRTATVKLPSIASTTTDKPLVVANHPLSPAYQRPVDNCVTANGASGAAVTATLPAAGVGLKHYITKIEMIAFAAAVRVAAATPVLVTTTNVVGTPTFTFQANAAALGTSEIQDKNFVLPLATTTANTATTIVCPATTSVIWRVNVFYYVAP